MTGTYNNNNNNNDNSKSMFFAYVAHTENVLISTVFEESQCIIGLSFRRLLKA